ncbi:MAG: tRNA dihydrouridine synthase DusB [Pseudomonadota bacterium]
MAGVTDLPYRNLCRSLGAHWVVSEMITSDSRLWQTKKSDFRLRFHAEAAPRWIQIAGADPGMMAEAARLNEAKGAQIVDINMGCPAKKVCNRAAGSALMRDEALVAEILAAVVGAVKVPVTLKMRLGWSTENRNAATIARIAESLGVSLVTVHGRTRACRFEGQVDYDAIGEVKSAVGIPVIANGDIDSVTRATAVLARTGCDAVMVGRAAQGQPWLPAHIDRYLQSGVEPENISLAEIKVHMLTHILELHAFYGEATGVRIARKHVGWYLKALEMESFTRRFNRLEQARDQVDALEGLPEKCLRAHSNAA